MSNEARIAFWIGIGAVLLLLLYILSPVLMPFLVSAFLAYMGDPIADWLEKHRFSRSWAVVTVFVVLTLVMTLVLLLLLPLIEQQISHLIRRIPAYMDWLQEHIIPWLHNTLGLDAGMFDLTYLKSQMTQSLGKVSGFAARIIGSVSKSSTLVMGWIANLLLIPVLTFYLLRDWDILVERVHELVPRRVEPRVARLARESDEVLTGFLCGQFMVMVSLGIVYSIGLAVVGLEFALLIGMLAGLVSFVPYLGFIVGIVVASIAALFQYQDIAHLLPVVVVFSIGQLIEGFILTPLLVGDRIGLHPVAVIFAVLAGGHLFGFFGILVALPVAAVIMVILRHTHEQYLKSELYDS